MAKVKLADGKIVEVDAEGLALGDQVLISPGGKAVLLRSAGQTKEATMADTGGQGQAGVQEGEKAGRRVKTGILEKLRELKDRMESWLNDYKGVMDWAAYEDGGWFNGPEGPTPPLMRTFKSRSDGRTWLLNWSMNAFLDKDSEIFNTKAIGEFVDRHADDEKKGEFWFWHTPGSKFADIKWQATSGRFLVEAGPFDDTPVGRLFEKVFTEHPRSHPAIAPGGWGSSPGYVYLGLDRMDKQYEWFEKYETSILPNSAAANPHNPPPQVLSKEDFMNASQKAALVALVGEKWAVEIEQLGESKTKELEQMQVAFKSAAEGEAAAATDATPEIASATASAESPTDEVEIETPRAEEMAQAEKQSESIADELKGVAEELRQVANSLPEPQVRQRLLTLADDVAGAEGLGYPYPVPGYEYAQAQAGKGASQLAGLADEVRVVAEGLKDAALQKRLNDLADKLAGLSVPSQKAQAKAQKAKALPAAITENPADVGKAKEKTPTLKGLGQQLRMLAGQVKKLDADAGAELTAIAEVLVGMAGGKYPAPQETYPPPEGYPTPTGKKEAGMADELATVNPNTPTEATATIPAAVVMATVEAGQKEQAAPDPNLAKVMEMLIGLQSGMGEMQAKLKTQEKAFEDGQKAQVEEKYEPFGWIPDWKAISVIGQRDALVKKGSKMAEEGPAEKARPVTGVDFLDELILAGGKGRNTEHAEAADAEAH